MFVCLCNPVAPNSEVISTGLSLPDSSFIQERHRTIQHLAILSVIGKKLRGGQGCKCIFLRPTVDTFKIIYK
jgi:hypothetical protein